MADAVDVGRFPDHQAFMVNARLHPADIIAHDEEDVGFLACASAAGAASGSARKTAVAVKRVSRFRNGENACISYLLQMKAVRAPSPLNLYHANKKLSCVLYR